MPRAARCDERLLDSVRVLEKTRDCEKLLAMTHVDGSSVNETEAGVDEGRKVIPEPLSNDSDRHSVAEGPVAIQCVEVVTGLVDALTQRLDRSEEQYITVEQEHPFGLQKTAEVKNFQRKWVRRAKLSAERGFRQRAFHFGIGFGAKEDPGGWEMSTELLERPLVESAIVMDAEGVILHGEPEERLQTPDEIEPVISAR
jgi:hypothetical protein